MAVTITKDGPDIFSTVCTLCGSEISYTFEDISDKSGAFIPYIVCPKCGRHLTHTINKKEKLTLNERTISSNGTLI